jgi:hypothetical protein
LGIHRPYLSETDLKGLSGDQVIAAAGRMRLTVESYLREMSVQNTLIECSLSQRIGFSGSTKAIFKADLNGLIPGMGRYKSAS